MTFGIGIFGMLSFTGCFSSDTPNVPIPQHKYNLANDPDYQEIENYVNYKLKQDVNFYYKKNFIERKIASNEDDLGIYTINAEKFSTYKREVVSSDPLDKVKFNIPSIRCISPKNKKDVYKKNFILDISDNKKIKEFDLKSNKYYLLMFDGKNIKIFEKLSKKECENNPYQTLCYTDQVKNNVYFYIKFENNHLIIQNQLVSKIAKPGDLIKLEIGNKIYKLLVPKP